MAPQDNLPKLLRLLPGAVLVATLAITWWLWDHERQSEHKELRSQFEFALRDTVSRIEQRESAYELMLRGVRSLFATTDLTAQDAVRDYLQALQLDANFSGVQGVGVIKWVPGGQRTAHIAVMRRLGAHGYALQPAGERDDYAPIIQSLPDTARHRAILGIDSWSDSKRRQALERARDSGLPAITEKVRLADDVDDKAPPGFVMYLPIYARGKALDSVVQRRASLLGWVYASFHMNEFMASLYGVQEPGLALTIYDGVNPSAATLLFGTGNGEQQSGAHTVLSAREYMVVAGHTWTLSLATQEAFVARFGRSSNLVIAVIGVFFSASMALLVWFMIAGRSHALRLADAMTEELRHMAQHDPLTGLPNRALFSDRCQQKLADANRRGDHLAMIFIDLDQFKPINDQHGHVVGDLLLRQVASRLGETVRATDTVGRIGGDEFVVLMGNLSDGDAALHLAEKIRVCVARPYTINNLTLSISCSIGVAVYPHDGLDEETLTKSADRAMYRAKERGRNGVERAVEVSVGEDL